MDGGKLADNTHLLRPLDGVSRLSTDRRAIPSVVRAWTSLGPAWRVAAVVAAVASVATVGHHSVGAASAAVLVALVPAALVDVHERRLPDGLVVLAATALAGIGVASGRLPLGPALAGIALFAGPICGLHLLSPRAMGFGDVKVAVVLGAAVGIVHWQLAAVALAVATALTAIVGLTTRRTTVPFGPGLLAGAIITLSTPGLFVPDLGTEEEPLARATSLAALTTDVTDGGTT